MQGRLAVHGLNLCAKGANVPVGTFVKDRRHLALGCQSALSVPVGTLRRIPKCEFSRGGKIASAPGSRSRGNVRELGLPTRNIIAKLFQLEHCVECFKLEHSRKCAFFSTQLTPIPTST